MLTSGNTRAAWAMYRVIFSQREGPLRGGQETDGGGDTGGHQFRRQTGENNETKKHAFDGPQRVRFRDRGSIF